MFIRKRPRWAISENQATSEQIFFNRRRFLISTGVAMGGLLVPSGVAVAADLATDPNADLYPAKRNEAFVLDRAVTDESLASTYNNFYEFGSHKRISKAAQSLKIRPWEIAIDGLVEKPFKIDFDDLIRKVSLEERLYRHRCVEAWSMAVPWTGFALKELINLAQPLSSAKFLRMETFLNPRVARGQRQSWYPWPYVEGLTMDEAAHDLAFMVAGVYGKPLAKQFGAPLRLAVPWKYGFKSIKSIVRFSFTDKEPLSFWQEVNGREFGFYANVNPRVKHARWSQAMEEVLGTDKKVPTLLYNGYAEEVSGLYEHIKERNIFY
jgi:sulfoxide reductase catalytic subunit YedY